MYEDTYEEVGSKRGSHLNYLKKEKKGHMFSAEVITYTSKGKPSVGFDPSLTSTPMTCLMGRFVSQTTGVISGRLPQTFT